jgi:hypothetical protein
MLSYFIIGMLAYSMAGLISGLKPGWPMAILGGFVGLLIGSVGGVLLLALIVELLGLPVDKDVALTMFSRGFWWALIGAFAGTYNFRDLRITEFKGLKIPHWLLGLGIVVVALVAYAILLVPLYQHAFRPDEARSVVSSPAAPAVSPAPESSSAATEEHFRLIYEAHPDTDSIVTNPAFTYWGEADPERQRIIKAGTAPEVIALFNEYKKHNSRSNTTRTAQPYSGQASGGYSQPCEYKQVMSNEDYAACGISPP